MAVSYKKLWKLLIDKDMKKKDLCAKAGISPASVTKMGRNGHVTTEILLKICTALDCRIEDIMEIIPDEAMQIHEMKQSLRSKWSTLSFEGKDEYMRIDEELDSLLSYIFEKRE